MKYYNPIPQQQQLSTRATRINNFVRVAALTSTTGIAEPSLGCSAPQSSGHPYRPLSRMWASPQNPGSSNTTQLGEQTDEAHKNTLVLHSQLCFLPSLFDLSSHRNAVVDSPTFDYNEKPQECTDISVSQPILATVQDDNSHIIEYRHCASLHGHVTNLGWLCKGVLL